MCGTFGELIGHFDIGAGHDLDRDPGRKLGFQIDIEAVLDLRSGIRAGGHIDQAHLAVVLPGRRDAGLEDTPVCRLRTQLQGPRLARHDLVDKVGHDLGLYVLSV